jgi:hypothetical protein
LARNHPTLFTRRLRFQLFVGRLRRALSRGCGRLAAGVTRRRMDP